tara:strand:- start:299 stop:856 length:558 start_codon:yes stop_codon:yes gene_type:complete
MYENFKSGRSAPKITHKRILLLLLQALNKEIFPNDNDEFTLKMESKQQAELLKRGDSNFYNAFDTNCGTLSTDTAPSQGYMSSENGMLTAPNAYGTKVDSKGKRRGSVGMSSGEDHSEMSSGGETVDDGEGDIDDHILEAHQEVVEMDLSELDLVIIPRVVFHVFRNMEKFYLNSNNLSVLQRDM